MLVPTHLVALRWIRCLLGLLLLAAAPAYAARGPQPALRIPLEPLGFQPITPQYLLAGDSMLTLHFVDDRHVLLTFNARTLLKRIPDDPPDDQDRNVSALLLELPSGRILARTEWRLHDHGQYLWPLSHGRFLLRIRNTLTTFAPLANLATDEPFRQRPLYSAPHRRIGLVHLTPDADMLILETKEIETKEIEAKPQTPKSQAALFGPTPRPAPDTPDPGQSPNPMPVLVNFYRLAIPPGPGDEVQLRSAGAGRSRIFGDIALTTAGHLDLIDQGRQSWAFNFDTFTGLTKELSAFDSTCRPYPVFVSHSEFIVFGCHGGQTRQVLGGFNMRGEQMWQQGLFGDYIAPHLVYAPSSGRFALGRVMATSSLVDPDNLVPEQLSSQNVVVYQTGSGNQIFKAECSPIERAGQNFALSPNGLSLGVIHAEAIEIYKLPPLTSKDQAAVELAKASAPEDTDLPVHVAGQSQPQSTKEADEAPAEPITPASTPPPSGQINGVPQVPILGPGFPAANTPSAPATNTSPAENASGDPQSDQPRKPPTLYTLPTDPPPNQPNTQPK